MNRREFERIVIPGEPGGDQVLFRRFVRIDMVAGRMRIVSGTVCLLAGREGDQLGRRDTAA